MLQSVRSHHAVIEFVCGLAAAAGLALPACTYDFDTSFDQTRSVGDGSAPDAGGIDVSSDQNPQDGPGQDQNAPEAGPDISADTVLDAQPDAADELASDVKPEVLPDATPDTAPDVAADVVKDVVPEAPHDVVVDPGCPPGSKSCGGICVGLDLPQHGCASAGCSPCAVQHGTATCSGGVCAIGACSAGWGNCNGSANDGCETSLATLSNCGACGTVCTPSGPHKTVSCVNGACVDGGCEQGFADCDGNQGNGCELLVYSDAAHCGSCSTACDGNQMCAAGQCVTSCAEAGLSCKPSPTSSCSSGVATAGQYDGGSRTVCIERGTMTSLKLALLTYAKASWILTGAVSRLSTVQVYSYDPGTTCVGGGAVPVAIQIAGSIPADPYSYGSAMSECSVHTGYAGAVFGVEQSQVCDLNCNLYSYTCLSINP